MKNKKQLIIIGILSFISMLSLIANYGVVENITSTLNTNVFNSTSSNAKNLLTNLLVMFQSAYNSKSIYPVVLLIALFKFYKSNIENCKRYKSSIVLSFLFGLFYVVSKSYTTYGDGSALYLNGFQIIYSLINLFGLTILFHNVISYIQNKIDNKEFINNETKDDFNIKKYILIMIIAWLPYLIIYSPGCIPPDTTSQIDQWAGIVTGIVTDPLTNHHPILTTFIFGIPFSIGYLFTNKLGLFFYIIFQVLIGSISFGLILKKLYKWGFSKKILNIVTIFYALVPIWGSAECSAMKDYMYFPVFIVYLMFYMDIVAKGDFDKRTLIKYIIASVILSLIRSEGIYIVLFSTLFLCFTLFKKKKSWILILFCLLFFVSNKAYISVLDNNGIIDPYDKREAYSIVFQCTARYAKEYGDELSDAEKELINEVLDYESIKKSYNFDNADGVKNTYKMPDSDTFNQYLKLWASCFIKHPNVYLNHLLCAASGYLLPGYNCPETEVYYLYTTYNPENHFYFSDEVRSVLESYINIWKNGPVTSLLFTPGLYTWIMIWCIWNLLRKKKYRLAIGIVPPMLVLGICFISPISGLLRYALPYIATCPLMICYSIRKTRENDDKLLV